MIIVQYTEIDVSANQQSKLVTVPFSTTDCEGKTMATSQHAAKPADRYSSSPHQESASERLPLLRHISIDNGQEDLARKYRISLCPLFLMMLSALVTVFMIHKANSHRWAVGADAIVPIEKAEEFMLEVDRVNNTSIQLWFRTWGNPNGVPVLFVHGGPGQAVADYENGNRRFFPASECFVVEVDQRGTGKSQPSVRDNWKNMKLYSDISIDQIADDYEVIRKHLGIEEWLVWGGSYGSTIGLNYAMRHPKSCISLILRGIYLDSIPELKEVYTQKAFEGNPRRLNEFQHLYEVADDYALSLGEETLDPNDAFRLFHLYERMVTSGDRMAIWTWHSFENNLMEEDPANLLDPANIVEEKFAEAQSVAFFEIRLWLHGTLEEPSNLLEKTYRLSEIPIWICQGLRDEVCPPHNARHLVDALEKETSTYLDARFLDSGHEDTDPVMEACLKDTMYQFLKQYYT